eukprot:SAG25_NODE_7921_length_450_cov_0.726496_1_plen_150_part_11
MAGASPRCPVVAETASSPLTSGVLTAVPAQRTSALVPLEATYTPSGIASVTAQGRPVTDPRARSSLGAFAEWCRCTPLCLGIPSFAHAVEHEVDYARLRGNLDERFDGAAVTEHNRQVREHPGDKVGFQDTATTESKAAAAATVTVRSAG